MPVPAQPYVPARAIDEIADFIGDPVAAAVFPEHRLRWRNDRAAVEVGLSALTDSEWIAHFGQFAPLPDSLPRPLALRYHGHQFRNYNPDIGDGRGFLFAQLRDSNDRLMDLGTKGSGQTPYSRFGDGRLTLKGGVREILATEMLEALGVETSRTFSLIETGEALIRGDEPSPTRSAVLVRLSHGHIRIGSFQRLAALGLEDEIDRLARYCLNHFYRETSAANARVTLLRRVVARTAKLAASYMTAGFVHGVLNTDNINITGESFDYGPWRFAPSFDAGFTAAYFDQSGLYAFGRQAEAIHWNCIQLAIALRQGEDTQALTDALDGFAPAYHAALIDRTLWRLGVTPRGEHDTALFHAIEAALIQSQCSIDAFYVDWAGGRVPTAGYDGPEFAALAARLADYKPSRSGGTGTAPCAMMIEEVEALWRHIAEDDNWQPLYDKVSAIRTMGAALANSDRAITEHSHE